MISLVRYGSPDFANGFPWSWTWTDGHATKVGWAISREVAIDAAKKEMELRRHCGVVTIGRVLPLGTRAVYRGGNASSAKTLHPALPARRDPRSDSVAVDGADAV